MLTWLYSFQHNSLFVQSDSEANTLKIKDAKNPPTVTPFLPLPTSTLKPSFTPTASLEPTIIPTTSTTPTITPTQGKIPDSAAISGIKGHPQLYTLDCEARSAVDWAQFFGVRINEQEFINRIPISDDPEIGFVGNINGLMGQFPLGDYGVHPPPIATLLQEYGLNAREVKNMSFEQLQREIAAGRPVIVWIVNLPFEIETTTYTASNGNTTVVARFEHTWIITGYNRYIVTVVDSEWTYNVKLQHFFDRWAALGNRAIVIRD